MSKLRLIIHALLFFLLINGIGYLADISDLYSTLEEKKLELAAKKTEQQVLAQKALLVQSQPKKISVENIHPVYLRYLLDLLATSGLKLQVLTQIESGAENVLQADVLRLVVKGDFQQFYQFLLLSNQKLQAIRIADFNFKSVEGGQAIFTMTASIWNAGVDYQLVMEAKKLGHDPLCFAASDLHSVDVAKVLQSVSVKQLKMIGYMQQDGVARAMLLLPDGRIAEVRAGMKIGKEGGYVRVVDEKRVEVLVDGKMVELKN